MRVAAIFDVHGNLPALEAVLAEPDVRAAEVVACGGDAVPGPFPRETLACLRSLGSRLVYVRGNGERGVLEAAGAPPSDDPIVEAARWCAAELDADELARLAALPLTATVGDVLVCHATPRSDEEIVTLVTPDERLRGILAGVSAPVIVAGHTHSQVDRTIDGIRYVNAGSVGMPYERGPGAYWALIGADVELRRTPYDAEAASARIRATGYPGADDFAREYVLSQHPPEETAPYFERLATDQEANSEK